MQVKNLPPSGTMTVCLHNVEFGSCIGIMPQEKRIAQKFRVSLSISFPAYGLSLDPDNLSCSVSYADLYTIVSDYMSQGGLLLEGIAVRIANTICAKYSIVEEGTIEIIKLNPPIPGINGDTGIKYFFKK